MSEETRESATQPSEVTPDGAETTGPATEPADGQLGDAGKRALSALRDEIKALKAQIKATETPADAERDASESAETPSDGARDATADVTPRKPLFQGTADGGAMRAAPDAKPQLTADDLQRMKPKQIEAARRNGQLRTLLSGK
ncbi:hypothetical protein ACFYSJ_21285 [Streptomyces sp. NPDC005248]|uniref:hypothetical protein n=1 Tax=Streptomyces sp. NPDC005248 TaxID=3364709 RepID=UPI00367DAE27